MNSAVYNPELYKFISISDFKQCMRQGGEVQVEWRGKRYFITWADNKIAVGERYYIGIDGKAHNFEDNSLVENCMSDFFDTADEALENRIGGDRLRDIITQVEVVVRTI